MAELTVLALKNDLPPHVANRAGEDQPGIFEDAVRKSKVWLAAQYRRCGQTSSDIDWDDSIVEEAALERAKYEVYAARETEDVAADKKENAGDLIEAVLGDCTGSEEGSGPGSAVTSGSKPSWMEHFEGRSDPEDDGTRRVP